MRDGTSFPHKRHEDTKGIRQDAGIFCHGIIRINTDKKLSEKSNPWKSVFIRGGIEILSESSAISVVENPSSGRARPLGAPWGRRNRVMGPLAARVGLPRG
jgi:hypothetical protein